MNIKGRKVDRVDQALGQIFEEIDAGQIFGKIDAGQKIGPGLSYEKGRDLFSKEKRPY